VYAVQYVYADSESMAEIKYQHNFIVQTSPKQSHYPGFQLFQKSIFRVEQPLMGLLTQDLIVIFLFFSSLLTADLRRPLPP
jgi:hypothetical protein